MKFGGKGYASYWPAYFCSEKFILSPKFNNCQGNLHHIVSVSRSVPPEVYNEALSSILVFTDLQGEKTNKYIKAQKEMEQGFRVLEYIDRSLRKAVSLMLKK